MLKGVIGPFFQTTMSRCHQLHRPISILSSHSVKDGQGKVKSTIYETANDQQESKEDYTRRSFFEMAQAVPVSMQDKDLIIAKINTSVIDHQAWEKGKKITVKWHGHLLVSIGRIVNERVELYTDLAVSKIPGERPFQGMKTIVEDGIISPKKRYFNGLSHNSKEYFSFVSLDNTILQIQEFSRRLTELKDKNEPYNHIDSACSQAAFEVLTGKRGKPKTSAQTAYINAIFEIKKNDDQIFFNNLRNVFSASGLSKPADELGKELNEQHLRNNRIKLS